MSYFITPAASRRGVEQASHRQYLSMRLERFIFCTTTTEVNPPDESRLSGIAGCDLEIAIRHKVAALCNKSYNARASDQPPG